MTTRRQFISRLSQPSAVGNFAAFPGTILAEKHSYAGALIDAVEIVRVTDPTTSLAGIPSVPGSTHSHLSRPATAPYKDQTSPRHRPETWPTITLDQDTWRNRWTVRPRRSGNSYTYSTTTPPFPDRQRRFGRRASGQIYRLNRHWERHYMMALSAVDNHYGISGQAIWCTGLSIVGGPTRKEFVSMEVVWDIP